MIKVKAYPFYAGTSDSEFFAKNADFDFPFKLKMLGIAAGIDLCTTHDLDAVEAVLLFRLDYAVLREIGRHRLLRKSVYVAMEPPVIRPLHSVGSLKWLSPAIGEILSWHDLDEAPANLRKFHFPYGRPVRPARRNFDEKAFITTVVGNKTSIFRNELYSERRKAILHFQRSFPETFTFYGTGWSKQQYHSWGGSVDNKLDTLSKFKFAICYENEKGLPGLFSEKLFDCMMARCIPIFWGAENVASYIPAECYVDRRKFRNYQALENYLLTITPAEYSKKIDAMEVFMLSDAFAEFSAEAFSRTTLQSIRETIAKPRLWGTNYSVARVGAALIRDTALRAINKLLSRK